MNKSFFSWLALGIGGLIVVILLRFGALGPEDDQGLPLLTSLFLAEFGFLATAAGAYFGYRSWTADKSGLVNLVSTIVCVVLSLGCAWMGMVIWSERVAGA